MTAAMAVVFVRMIALASQNLVATEVDAGVLDPLALILDEEMPSVAWNLLLMSVILLLSVLLVGKSLGGWYFLAINFVVFTALCKMFRSQHEYFRNYFPCAFTDSLVLSF